MPKIYLGEIMEEYEEYFNNLLYQKCVVLKFDDEFSYEFFIFEPIDINDMYNQN